MGDEIYENAVASEEGFNKWWPQFLTAFHINKQFEDSRTLAQRAWRAGWDARKTAEFKAAYRPEPGSDHVGHWHDLRRGLELATKHSLVIQTTASPNGCVVQASRGAKLVLAETKTLHEMVETLKAMEERGAL